MKTFITVCCTTYLLFILSCSPAPLPMPTENIVGTWKTTAFQMGASDVNAYISLAFYENHHFSFKLSLPLGGDNVRPFKWGGDWMIDRSGNLQLNYEGERGFLGTFADTREVFEKFEFTLRNDRLLMESEFFNINYNLDLQRAE
ncbi:MAG: hypothetical protein AB8G22_29400 [Saprospiraceae bacterium]